MPPLDQPRRDPAPRPALARLRALARRLTEPHPALRDEEQRRRARLLSALLAATIPLSVAASLLSPSLAGTGRAPWAEPMTLSGLATCALGLGAYALSRTRHSRAAALVTVALAVQGTWAALLLSSGTPHATSAPYFLSISVILSALLLPLPYTVGLAAANVAAILALPQLIPALGFFDAGNAALLLTFTSAFIVVFAAVRRQDLQRLEAQGRVVAEKEERLRAVVSNAPDIIMMVDRGGVIRYINRTVPGLTPEGVVGTTVYEYVAEPERARLAALLDTVFATGEGQSYEMQGHGPWGEPSWYASRLGAIFRDGEVVAATLITTDIGDLKRAEEERARGRERALELERLRESAKFRSNFINLAAHELRTPMTPIKTQLFILKRRRSGSWDEDERRAFDLLERNVGRLTALLRDLLDGARIQSGGLDLHPEDLDLARLAAVTVEAHRGAAALGGVALSAALDESLPVRGDAARLAQVLANLLENAIKFTPHGGKVRVEVRREGDEAVVRVRDTGLGVEPEQLVNLFQPFSQMRFAADQSSDGTGLALYISKEFVERHGGRLWCESQGKGQGCTFAVALPLGAPRAAGKPMPPAAAGGAAAFK